MPFFEFLRKSDAAETAARNPPAPDSNGLPTGNETILVADDESIVRQVIAIMLEEQGYQVVQAADGQEALRRCQDDAQKIDLVISDILMPNMTGRQLACQLSRVRPQTKVILCSGCAERLATRTGMTDMNIPFFKKPVTPRDLALKVREVLDGPTATSDSQQQLQKKNDSDPEFAPGIARGTTSPANISPVTDYQV
jgi:DNA-binding NtrC family response regulator